MVTAQKCINKRKTLNHNTSNVTEKENQSKIFKHYLHFFFQLRFYNTLWFGRCKVWREKTTRDQINENMGEKSAFGETTKYNF